ncbi:amidoligase family protein [Deltaproteobacteria bacterium TL4]
MTFILPPQTCNDDQQLRRVGFEIEFAGLDFQDVAKMIVELFGGTHVDDDRFENKVVDTQYGNFTLEIDWSALKNRSYEEFLGNLGITINDVTIRQNIEEFLIKMIKPLIPAVLSSHPLLINESSTADILRSLFKEQDAFLKKFGIRLDELIKLSDVEKNLNKFLTSTINDYLSSLIFPSNQGDLVKTVRNEIKAQKKVLKKIGIHLEKIPMIAELEAFFYSMFTSSIGDILSAPPLSLEEFDAVKSLRAMLDEQEEFLKRFNISIGDISIKSTVEEFLARVASTVVPYEITTPPFPIDKLAEMEKLRKVMQENSALGTTASIIYAFGLHINPEVPSMKAESLLRHIRAFILLYEWIFEESEVAISRRLSPYIDEFPKAYCRWVLEPSYNPTMDELIDDYLKHNPTRNRPLDMLPVFTLINKKKIRRQLKDEKINPRPTFHFRLPNCLVDIASWTIAQEWNHWVQVERLAADPRAIQILSKKYLKLNKKHFNRRKWAKKMKKWIQS